MNLYVPNSLVTALAFAGITGAWAADGDKCDDVLKDGTKAVALYNRNYAYRQLVDIHFARVGYEQAKKSSSLTGNIPVGDVVLGAGFTQDSYRLRREAIQKSELWRTEIQDDQSYFAASGDREIVDAWAKCMSENEAGLFVTFENIAPTTATARIRWSGKVGVNSVDLRGDFKLPVGAQIQSGQDCFKTSFLGPKKIHTNTQGCLVVFELDSARRPLPLALNTKNGEGSASAYLPPRMYLKRHARPYKFVTRSNTADTCGGGVPLLLGIHQRTGRNQVAGSFCSDSRNGWTFAPSTFQGSSSIIKNFKDGRTQHSNVEASYPGSSQLLVTLYCTSTGKHYQTCSGSAAIEEERYVWTEMTGLSAETKAN